MCATWYWTDRDGSVLVVERSLLQRTSQTLSMCAAWYWSDRDGSVLVVERSLLEKRSQTLSICAAWYGRDRDGSVLVIVVERSVLQRTSLTLSMCAAQYWRDHIGSVLVVVTKMELWTSEEDISRTTLREVDVCNNEVQFAFISLDLPENSSQQRWWWLSIFPQYFQVTNSVHNPMAKGSATGETNIGNLWCHLVVNISKEGIPYSSVNAWNTEGQRASWLIYTPISTMCHPVFWWMTQQRNYLMQHWLWNLRAISDVRVWIWCTASFHFVLSLQCWSTWMKI